MVTISEKEITIIYDGFSLTYPIEELLIEEKEIIYNELVAFLKRLNVFLDKEVFRSVLFACKEIFLKRKTVTKAIQTTLKHKTYGNLIISDIEILEDFVKEVFYYIEPRFIARQALLKHRLNAQE